MWLAAARSNNDPEQVCTYFAAYIKEINGLPYAIRADRGNENINIEAMQRLLRSLNDDERSELQTNFMCGQSTSNQRIEAFWSILPCLGMKVWINFFQMMENFGIIDTSSVLDIECVRFVFMDLLNIGLHQIKDDWNVHYVRHSKASLAPSGRPEIMYNLPEAYNVPSYRCDLDVSLCSALCDITCVKLPACREPYFTIFQSIMSENGHEKPSSLVGGAMLFCTLLDRIEEECENL